MTLVVALNCTRDTSHMMETSGVAAILRAADVYTLRVQPINTQEANLHSGFLLEGESSKKKIENLHTCAITIDLKRQTSAVLCVGTFASIYMVCYV